MRLILAVSLVGTLGILPAQAQDGSAIYRQKACPACHEIGEGAVEKIGPHLNGVVGRPVAGVSGYRYSQVMQDAGAEGRVWDRQELLLFLKSPRHSYPGSKMNYAGIKSRADIEAVIDYLATVAPDGTSARP